MRSHGKEGRGISFSYSGLYPWEQCLPFGICAGAGRCTSGSLLLPFFFFLGCSLALSPGWSAVVWSRLTATSSSQGSSSFPASISLVAGTTGTCHHTWLIFVFLIETGFHHVRQDDLDLLTSWAACLGLPKYWITGVSHCTRPAIPILYVNICSNKN